MKIAVFVLLILAMAGTGIAARLTWDANSDASEYHIYNRVAGSSDWVEVGVTQDLEYDLEPLGLTGGTTYQFTIKAFNACGNSSDFAEPVSYNACGVVDAVQNMSVKVILEFTPGGSQ